MKDLYVGQRVTYVTEFKRERGVVKSLYDDDYVFVVYHCSNEWENYENYTAAKTYVGDLVEGWI